MREERDTQPSAPGVSIVLLTHDAGPGLDRVLDAVFGQEGAPPFELIAIDTESVDGTLERLQKRPLRVERITRAEFSHPGTRNLGVRLARAPIVSFLVQDAIPFHARWLANLIAPLAEDPRVAAAYSRQVPRERCNPVERHDIHRGAPAIRRVKRLVDTEPFLREDYRRNLSEFILFSNVASCARRELLLRYPFDERLPMVEDQEWCKRILEAGLSVVYEPASVVIHSHDHGLRQVYRRHADYGRAFALFHPVQTSLAGSVLAAAYESLGDYLFLLQSPGPFRSKLQWIPGIPARRLAMKLGFHRGLRTRPA